MDTQAACAMTFTQLKDGHKFGSHLFMHKGSKSGAVTKHSESSSDSPLFVNTDEDLEPYDDYACNTDEEYEPYDKSRGSHLYQDGGDSDSEDESIRCSKNVGLQGRIKSWADYQSEDDDHDDYHNASGPIIERGKNGVRQPTPTPAAPESPPGQFQSPPGQFFARPAGSQQVPPMAQAPPQGMPVPCAPVAAEMPPAVRPPPGAWLPREQVSVYPKQFAPASAHAQVGAPSEVRLVRAMRAPAPLSHNKKQPVTSLTINHLPFQMRRSQLCDLLDESGFAGRYDYLYVPCNEDKTNRGHAFINMRSPADANEFFAVLHGARVVGVSSDTPVLSLAVSTVQGFEASIQRWTVAKMLSLRDPDFRPFIAGMNL